MKSKEILWQNIQKIAKEISEADFNQLLILENKIQRLYEDFIIFKNTKEEAEFVENKEFEAQKPNEIHEKIITQKPEILKNITPKRSTNYQLISLNFNDKFAFLSQLFNNDLQALNDTIGALNLSESKQDSLLLLKLLKQKYNWNDLHQEYLERLEELIEKRFEV